MYFNPLKTQTKIEYITIIIKCIIHVDTIDANVEIKIHSMSGNVSLNPFKKQKQNAIDDKNNIDINIL